VVRLEGILLAPISYGSIAIIGAPIRTTPSASIALLISSRVVRKQPWRSVRDKEPGGLPLRIAHSFVKTYGALD